MKPILLSLLLRGQLNSEVFEENWYLLLYVHSTHEYAIIGNKYDRYIWFNETTERHFELLHYTNNFRYTLNNISNVASTHYYGMLDLSRFKVKKKEQ